MDPATIEAHIHALGGVETMTLGDDRFFIHNPDGALPDERKMPFATIVTSDAYDSASDLGREGVYRLNIGLPRDSYRRLFGTPPAARADGGPLDTGHDATVLDVVVPHPVYASQHWVCVLNPRDETFATTVGPLLAEAHDFAARKSANRAARTGG